MDVNFYLDQFNKAGKRLNKKEFEKRHLEIFVGVVLNSVCLKIYKKQWSGDHLNPVQAATRIFFSIWVNDLTPEDHKLYYNIHAFKLRHLKGYKIESRKFADLFRKDFKKGQKQWPNVSTQFGALTLMEGWMVLDENTFQNDIEGLCNKFLDIEHLVDSNLNKFRK